MSYDRIIRDALRLARSPRRFALGGEADPKDISPSISNPVSVFPKPQRMFPSDAPVPGGQYLGMPDKQDMTGHKSAVASIGVHPGGKPYFNASRDAVDQTGTAGKAKTKTNLFKQKAGWSWQTAPEGHEDTNTIVSVEHRGKHYYTLNAHFPKGVDFARYAESRSEPRLRPTTTGDVFLGPQAGTISVRGKEHPVYHHVVVKADGGAVGYASGGDVDQPRNLDDMGFYSSAAESARSLPQSKGTPQQMLATMKGVKPAELEWSGVQDKFAGQKSVTKDDLAQHFEQNVPEIKETVLGGKKEKNNMPTRQEVRNEYVPKLLYYNDIDEKYNSMIADGKGHLLTEKDHEEYQHALSEMDRLTMEMHEKLEEIEGNEYDNTKYSEYTVGSRYGNTRPSQRNYREVLLHLPGEKKFQSSHWEPANIVAHLRMQDRGPNNNILHLEELQSDWAQKGRDEGFSDPQDKINYETKLKDLANRAFEEAYQNAINKTFSRDFAEKFANKIRDTFLHHNAVAMFPEEADSLNKLYEKYKNYFSGVPKSPYVTNTDHWVELGLKRALLEAARGGYDKLVWTPGEEQAKRYDLSKQVNKITYHPLDKAFNAYDKSGRNVIYENDVEPHDIKKYIGNELAERLLEKSNYSKSLLDEYEVLRHPDSNKWGLYLYGEPSHDYGGEILEFDSKSDAREHLNDKLREEIDRHLPSLEGLDLKVGGEGMKSFYDKILPSALRRVLKPHTDKIQPTSHVVKGNDGEDVTLPGIEITPELRESILKRGFSYYARGGEVRQHFEDGGDAEGGSPAGDTGGFMGDTTGMDTAPAPSNVGYSAEDENAPPPNVTQQNPYSHFEGVPVLESVEKSITTGPGLVGAIAPQPFGALAAIAESINNAYYDGKARADIDPNAGGAGTSEQPQFQQTSIYDVQQNPVVGKALDVTAPKGQFTINESLTKPSIVEAPVAAPAPAPEPQFFAPAPAPTPTPAPAPAPTPQPFPTAAPELEEPAPILPEPQPTPALATVPPVVYHSDRDDIGSGLPFPKADEEDPQKLIQAFSVGKPKLPPMMARGGVPRNSHPALSIPGVHIREEIHGRPIFLGERDG